MSKIIALSDQEYEMLLDTLETAETAARVRAAIEEKQGNIEASTIEISEAEQVVFLFDVIRQHTRRLADSHPLARYKTLQELERGLEQETSTERREQ